MDRRDLGLCNTMGQVGLGTCLVPKLTNTPRFLGSCLPYNTADKEVVNQLV